ncbi:MAG: hypothetical protein ACYDEV_12130 [Acidiferrobacter sp.]
MRRAPWILATAFLGLSACGRHPPKPAPPTMRPTVARATLTLRPSVNKDAHGDIVIPRIAITNRSGIPSVFVLSAHGRARLRLVKIGATTAHKAEILSGLSGNETLILPPFRDVYDGSPVRKSGQS